VSRKLIALAVLTGLMLIWPIQSVAAAQPQGKTYQITITNLTSSQIFSPPLLATHSSAVRLFEVGQPASDELRLVAEGGNSGPLADRLLPVATDVQRTSQPIMPGSSLTVEITAQEGDLLSLVCMLATTNDGFVGLDSQTVPADAASLKLGSFDAGTENNTESRADVPGPPYGGMGEPATLPREPIRPHPGIVGVGDVTADFDWQDPVAQVEVALLATEPAEPGHADLGAAVLTMAAGAVAAFLR
jgi:hypothetical protein